MNQVDISRPLSEREWKSKTEREISLCRMMGTVCQHVALKGIRESKWMITQKKNREREREGDGDLAFHKHPIRTRSRDRATNKRLQISDEGGQV